jgi:hypothetical protein
MLLKFEWFQLRNSLKTSMLELMMKSISLIFLHLKDSGLGFYLEFSHLFLSNVLVGVFFTMVRADGTVVPARTNGH